MLLWLMSLTVAMAQQTITGVVLDDQGQPLPSATVQIKGTNTGTSTDFDGNYSIAASNGDVLVFSYVGFSTQEVGVAGQDQINVTLAADNQLDEVVVSALGVSREKKSLGYAQQSVQGETLVQSKEVDLNVTLSGKVAGVQMIGGSSSTFDAGFLRLRGETGVLYVVDGIKVNAMTDINTDNIANISVLKGAAATALYGADAVNGVVIITSKKSS
jgi:TonB-dependent SusC/RagA subfamily outer membrane receptor